ncbi:MFS general substrate transporter [Amanita rubescens]|nr:MFS general substrate transporter [Amanita rubescens]
MDDIKGHDTDVEKSDLENTVVSTNNSSEEFNLEKGITRAYELKCDLVNKCLQEEIGFGRYQQQLFVLSGLGWLTDNLWFQGVALVLPQVQQELNPSRIEFTTLGLYAGLVTGAMTWGIFGIAAGGANSFTSFAALVACMGFGVGGNLPVDVKIWDGDIHSIPCKILALVEPLSKLLLVFVMRFIVFDLQESSKYFIAKGRDQEAIELVGTEKLFRLLSRSYSPIQDSSAVPRLTNVRLVKSSLSSISLKRVSDTTSFSLTYRNYTILSVLGVPGSLVACAVVDWTRKGGKFSVGGRKLTLAISTALTGVFLFLFTTSATEAAVLAYSCASSVTQLFILFKMYGVLYAYTPEVFPAPHRGTGDALAASINRVAGILAPIIKTTTTSKKRPLLTMFLPIETAGRAAISKPEDSAAPSRQDRQQCWDSRDAYFACLDKVGVIKAGEEKDACAATKAKYEKDCAKSWIDYFNQRRVIAEAQKDRLARGNQATKQ